MFACLVLAGKRVSPNRLSATIEKLLTGCEITKVKKNMSASIQFDQDQPDLRQAIGQFLINCKAYASTSFASLCAELVVTYVERVSGLFCLVK